jgi:hypothetical protein
MLHSKRAHHQTLTPTRPEWARMWESLFDLTGSYTDHNPRSGEFWEYTGTFWKDRPAIGSLLPLRLLVHEFRHRDRAETCKPIAGVARHNGRVVLHVTTSIEHSGGWNTPIGEGSLV